jgi:hypothetical protein
MTEVTKSPTRRLGWLGAWVVAVGLAVGTFGSGVAWADEAAGSSGDTDTPSSASDTSSRSEDSPRSREHDGPSSVPPGIRIATRTIDKRINRISEMGEMESLRLQMAMDRMSKMMSTLSNVLRKASQTAQNITGNIK